jgi:hypothetical protein
MGLGRKGSSVQRRRWTGIAVAAFLLLLAPLGLASNSSLYSDADGDAAVAAPDLTDVQVSNDDAGTVVFRISIANRAALEDSDLVAVLVDADGNTRTGCARGTFGAEYALDVLARRFVFGRCTAGRWSFTRRPASFAGSFASSGLTLRVNRKALGGTNGFTFRIGSAATSAADAAYDFAPDVGVGAWSYKIIAPRAAAVSSPKRKAKACKRRHAHRCVEAKRR